MTDLSCLAFIFTGLNTVDSTELSSLFPMERICDEHPKTSLPPEIQV